jgi:hypothetical protein
MQTDKGVDRRDRLPVVASYLSPFAGVPWLGPWIIYACLPESSQARAHVARAFDLHLAAVVLGGASLVVGFVLFGDSGAIVASGVTVLAAMVLDIVLLVSALLGTRLSAPWRPVVLGHRTFYRQEPFVR